MRRDTDSDCCRFVEAHQKASERTRIAIGLIVALSIAILAAILNSSASSWDALRMRTVMSYDKKIVASANEPSHSVELLPETMLSSLYLVPKTATDTEKAVFLTGQDIDRLNSGGIHSFGDFVRNRDNMVDHIKDNSKLTIPLVGVSFDVNDLGIISILMFAALSGFLLKALRREQYNLTQALDSAEDLVEKRRVYTLLSLGEVLSLPSMIDQRRRLGQVADTDQKPMSSYIDNISVAKMAAGLPCLLVALVIVNDVRTFGYGYSLSPTRVICNSILEGVGLLLLIQTCRDTLILIKSITSTWDTTREKIEAGKLGLSNLAAADTNKVERRVSAKP